VLIDRKEESGKPLKITPESVVWSFWETNCLLLPNLAKLFKELALFQPTSAGNYLTPGLDND
jgi:hypothetical protein